MKKEELQNIVSISIALASISTLIYMITNNTLDLITFYRGASLSITIVTLFWVFYFSYGWKISFFDKQLFYRPNLNGTWMGTLISDWKDEDGNVKEPIEFYLVIRQSFIRMHFTTFTDDFVGVSYAETFALNKDKGLKNIAYLYRKDSTQSNDENLREGATELRLIIEGEIKKLEGKYWSNTKTEGKIKVEFLTEEHLDSFNHAKKIKGEK